MVLSLFSFFSVIKWHNAVDDHMDALVRNANVGVRTVDMSIVASGNDNDVGRVQAALGLSGTVK